MTAPTTIGGAMMLTDEFQSNPLFEALKLAVGTLSLHGHDDDAKKIVAEARTLLSATKSATQIGIRLVPIVPTEEMIVAGNKAILDQLEPAMHAWDAMLAAAPAAPAQSPSDFMDRVHAALPEFTRQDDYFLAHGASLMSEESHEIIHVDTLRKIATALAQGSHDIPSTGYIDHSDNCAGGGAARPVRVDDLKATEGPLLELDGLMASYHAAVWNACEAGALCFDEAGVAEAKAIQRHVRAMLTQPAIAGEAVAWFHNTACAGDKPHYEQVADEFARPPAIALYTRPATDGLNIATLKPLSDAACRDFSTAQSAVVLGDDRAAFEAQFERTLGYKPERYSTFNYERDNARSLWKWWQWAWQARAASPQAAATQTVAGILAIAEDCSSKDGILDMLAFRNDLLSMGGGK